MSDLVQVLRLWQQVKASGEDCVLATIVRVDGSSYRKPGARMLIASSGLRAGAISGGCLEAEVCRQAWWLTAQGPVVKAYSTSFETDGDRPYGLGCGGTVHVLLERRVHAESFLDALQGAFAHRRPVASSVVLSGQKIGLRSIAGAEAGSAPNDLQAYAQEALEAQSSAQHDDGAVWAEYIAPRAGLFIFGAGDDAKPLVTQAATLGWHITIADGRAHLASRQRFPEADQVVVLTQDKLDRLGILASDAAVIMTHSYAQDAAILQALLKTPLAYLGVLGPRYRTADLLAEVEAGSGMESGAARARVHSPIGLDLGGDSPATIALSILAEIQATLSRRRFARIERPSGRPSPPVESVASLSVVVT